MSMDNLLLVQGLHVPVFSWSEVPEEPGGVVLPEGGSTDSKDQR